MDSHLVVDVCDVHAVEDVVLEVIPQDPPQDVEGDVGPATEAERLVRMESSGLVLGFWF